MSQMTVAAMFVRAAGQGTAVYVAVGKCGATGSNGFYLASHGNTIRFQFDDALGGTAYQRGSKVLTAGEVYLCVGTYDGITGHTYVDGVLDDGGASVDRAGIVIPNTNKLTIGARADGASNRWIGHLFGVWIWDYAMTAGQVKTFSADPWGLARPRTPKIYAISPLTKWYYLYRGEGGISEVDFSNEVATVGGGNASNVFSGLIHEANTRYTYVLRPARKLSDDSILITPDMSCRVEFETDDSGDWLGNRPGSVEGMSAEIISGGQIRLRWRYRTPYGGDAPNDFGIYYSTSPNITPGSPNATESYTADGAYSKEITLSDGVAYYFAITARDAAPVESHISEIIGPFIADGTAPDAPSLLTSTTF
jgi:hypothetical protein